MQGIEKMKVLITGVCGFVGSSLVERLRQNKEEVEIVGIDNLIRSGSETNRRRLKEMGVRLYHGDIRMRSDFEALPDVDWVVDAAANPSVMAGVDGKTSSRQLLEHNLGGTIELLEYCRSRKAGFILLSTSRVYGVEPLASLPMKVVDRRFVPDLASCAVSGVSVEGVSEDFPAEPPLSLYGTSKRAAELLALEYGQAFDFPVWINRCGVMAGAGQFGRADQGIVSFWIHAWRAGLPLRYIGFGGSGHQVRDFFHPGDLVSLMLTQMRHNGAKAPRIVNLGGGTTISVSLAELSDWCCQRFGKREVEASKVERPFDIPWMVMDSSLAKETWGWQPETTMDSILEEIASHAESHPDWLQLAE